ncbi:YheC/YheD family protein [Salinicoccus albus]|uniref:YheC/YheD family protein n=1 Tax=Salinicoccus albus TaxID=418756 RepID=UPI000376DBCE|nr:YheC/YheD family protein [Salinicoccus albus]
MTIGVMANFKKPTKIAKYISLISQVYGIEVIYMRPGDINIENDTVVGKVFVNNEWVEKQTGIPPFIDIAPYCFKKKNKAITDYLKRKTFLSDNRDNVLTKRALQEKLLNDPKFSHLVIPTHRIQSFEDMQKYLEKYSKIVLKPSWGIQGKGIYILEQLEDGYLLGHNIQEDELNESELEGFFNHSIAKKGYVLQQYVSSRTSGGEPFDCRIHVEKNEHGEWESARNYIRIGIGQKVISNVNQGGGISKPVPFLKANFGRQWKAINQKLNQLAVTLPYKVESLRSTHIMSLGMDIGIGRDGQLYLFEVNDGPDTSAVIAEVAYLRSNYYRYILRNRLNMPEKNRVEYEKYQAVLEERDQYRERVAEIQSAKESYEQKYHEMKESTSWKVSKPIRKAGSIMKNFRSKG